MRLPNLDRAIIDPAKLRSYVLNTEHKRGGTRARLLARFGYHRDQWRLLEAGIRRRRLEADVQVVRSSPYGVRYEIRAPLHTPVGRELMVRTIWQIDEGTDVPRLITLFPD
jgi:hypothetical protein